MRGGALHRCGRALALACCGGTHEVCASAWKSAVDASGGALSGTVRADKGWCAVDPTGDAVLGVPLSELRFRLDQLALPPDGRSLEVAVDVVETDIGILEGVARAIWDPARSTVTLNAFTLEGEDGRRLNITAQLIAPAGQDDDLDRSRIAGLALEAASVTNCGNAAIPHPDGDQVFRFVARGS